MLLLDHIIFTPKCTGVAGILRRTEAPWRARYESGDSKTGSLQQPATEMQKGRSVATAAFLLSIARPRGGLVRWIWPLP
ncbi:hypothetical protein EAS54_18545 [Bradyrhizobium guangzhouense]|nr:hypothetical protein EAS54_18545 [Bradyrhizobium guangzhouense]